MGTRPLYSEDATVNEFGHAAPMAPSG